MGCGSVDIRLLTDKQRDFLIHVQKSDNFVINEHENARINRVLKEGIYNSRSRCMFNDLRERYIKEKKLT